MSDQGPTLRLSYLDRDISDLMPTNHDLDESDSLINLSILQKDADNNSPQNNVRPIEAVMSLGDPLTGTISSRSVSTQYLCSSFQSDEAVLTKSTTIWPSGCMPLWPQPVSKGISSSTSDAESLNASVSDFPGYDIRRISSAISSASSTTDLGQCDYGRSWLPGNSEWMKRKSVTCEQDPTSENSGIGLDAPRTVPHTSLRPPESLNQASSSRQAQPQQLLPQSQSPSSLSRPEQRPRIRRAANKSRAKNKAAISALEAAEKAESLKHKTLSETVKGLQEEVLALKSELLMHANCNNFNIQTYLEQRARQVAISNGATGGLGSSTSHLVATGDATRIFIQPCLYRELI